MNNNYVTKSDLVDLETSYLNILSLRKKLNEIKKEYNEYTEKNTNEYVRLTTNITKINKLMHKFNKIKATIPDRKDATMVRKNG